jgi:predicted DNA-binding protein YlxM (UPF0122 family)
MPCQECQAKSSCKSLCSKAEKSVNQDHVSQRETCHSEIDLDLLEAHVKPVPLVEVQSNNAEHELSFPFLTPLQNKILTLFYFKGLSYKEIAKCLSGGHPSKMNNIRARSVERRLSTVKKKLCVFFSNSKEENIKRRNEDLDEPMDVYEFIANNTHFPMRSKPISRNYDYSTDDYNDFEYQQDRMAD